MITNILPCADLHVGVTKNELVRNQPTALYINYHNSGNNKADEVYIIVKLDERIKISSSSKPYTQVSKGKIRFDVSQLPAGTSGKIKLELLVGSQTSLYTNLSIEAQIYPHTNCHPSDGYNQWFEIDTQCDTGIISFMVRNTGVSMNGKQRYTLMLDGQTVMDGDYKLANNEVKTIKIDAHGQIATLMMYEEDQIIQSQTYEGCGSMDNGYASVNLASLLNQTSVQPYEDKSYLELRDFRVGKVMYQDSIYAITNETTSSMSKKYGEIYYQYSNSSSDSLRGLIIKIQGTEMLYPEIFGIIATSHAIEWIIQDDKIVIKLLEAIGPMEDLVCKIKAPINDNNTYLGSYVKISTLIKETIVDLKSYNGSLFSVSKNINSSPQNPVLKNGQLVGRGNSINHSHSIVTLDNGDKIFFGYIRALNKELVLVAYKFDKNEKWVWTKEYNRTLIPGATSMIYDVVLLPDCTILVITFGDPLIIDTNGNMLESTNYSKLIEDLPSISITTITPIDNNKIMLLGQNIFEGIKEFYKIITTNNFKLLSNEKVNFNVQGANTYVDKILKNKNGIAVLRQKGSAGKRTIFFTLLKMDGSDYKSVEIDLISSERIYFFLKDAYIAEAGKIILTGSSQRLISNKYQSGIEIIETDYQQKIQKYISVFPSNVKYSVSKVMKKNNNYLFVGEVDLEGSNQYVNYLMEMTPDNQVVWLVIEEIGNNPEFSHMHIAQDGRVFAAFTKVTSPYRSRSKMAYIYSPEESVDSHLDADANDYSKLVVYPNPTPNHLIVYDPDKIYTDYCIYTFQGQLVTSGSYNETCIDVSNLISGNYILQMIDKHGKRRYVTFVKM